MAARGCRSHGRKCLRGRRLPTLEPEPLPEAEAEAGQRGSDERAAAGPVTDPGCEVLSLFASDERVRRARRARADLRRGAGPERPFLATRQMPSPTFTPTYGARDGRDGCACPAPRAAAAAKESAAVPTKQFLAAAVSCCAAAAGSAVARPLRLLKAGASLLLLLLLLLASCVVLLVHAWGTRNRTNTTPYDIEASAAG